MKTSYWITLSIRSRLQIPKDTATDEGAMGGIPFPEGNSKLSTNHLSYHGNIFISIFTEEWNFFLQSKSSLNYITVNMQKWISYFTYFGSHLQLQSHNTLSKFAIMLIQRRNVDSMLIYMVIQCYLLLGKNVYILQWIHLPYYFVPPSWKSSYKCIGIL